MFSNILKKVFGGPPSGEPQAVLHPVPESDETYLLRALKEGSPGKEVSQFEATLLLNVLSIVKNSPLSEWRINDERDTRSPVVSSLKHRDKDQFETRTIKVNGSTLTLAFTSYHDHYDGGEASGSISGVIVNGELIDRGPAADMLWGRLNMRHRQAADRRQTSEQERTRIRQDKALILVEAFNLIEGARTGNIIFTKDPSRSSVVETRVTETWVAEINGARVTVEGRGRRAMGIEEIQEGSITLDLPGNERYRVPWEAAKAMELLNLIRKCQEHPEDLNDLKTPPRPNGHGHKPNIDGGGRGGYGSYS